MTAAVSTCWCGGKKSGEPKHRRKGEPACEASKEDRRAYDKERGKDPDKERKRNKVRTAMARWKPGTLILVEEIEEL